MSTHEDNVTAERFRAISEACLRVEHAKDFGLRLLNGLNQNGVLPADSITPEIKDQLAQLPHPNKNEANAISKISRSVFKKFFKNILLNSKEFKAGFISAVLIDLDQVLKDPELTDQDRNVLLSLVISTLGFGSKVNQDSNEKLRHLIAKYRFLYENADKLPLDHQEDFFKGFIRGKKFVSIGEKILAKGPDSTKTYLLIAILGKNNRLLRSASDLFQFMRQSTNLNLKFDWDSYKNALKDVSWRGAKFLRLTRSKKSGVSKKPPAP